MSESVPPEGLGDGAFELRQWRTDQAAVLTDLVIRNLEHLRPWQPFVRYEPMSVDDRERLIDGWATARTSGGDAVYGIYVHGLAVGNCGLHRRLGPGALEIGYWVAGDHLRRGYATRAAGLLTDAAFSFDDIALVEIHHDAANVASGGIPRKLGFDFVEERVGGVEAEGETGVEWIWRMKRAAWTRR